MSQTRPSTPYYIFNDEDDEGFEPPPSYASAASSAGSSSGSSSGSSRSLPSSSNASLSGSPRSSHEETLRQHSHIVSVAGTTSDRASLDAAGSAVAGGLGGPHSRSSLSVATDEGLSSNGGYSSDTTNHSNASGASQLLHSSASTGRLTHLLPLTALPTGGPTSAAAAGAILPLATSTASGPGVATAATGRAPRNAQPDRRSSSSLSTLSSYRYPNNNNSRGKEDRSATPTAGHVTVPRSKTPSILDGRTVHPLTQARASFTSSMINNLGSAGMATASGAGGILMGTDSEGLTSRFSSRAPSPVMGSSASNSSASSSTHTHIHHHYHHSSGETAGPPSAYHTQPNSRVSSPTSRSAKGKERTRSSGAVGATFYAGGHTPCSSVDYAIPSDGPYGSTYHYRNGPLARKLGNTILSRDPSLTDLPLLAASSVNGSPSAMPASSRRRSGWKSPRRKVTDTDDDSDLSLDTSVSLRHRRKCSTFFPFPGAIKAWHRFTRHPLVPTQPLTILFALGLFASFAYSLTTFIYHVLSTDKAPRPWRTYCQEQRPFPHDLADSLAPVDVFVGVFSVDAAYERRHLIRSTYLRHSRPIDPYTGLPGHNVQVKFILGRPRKHHARRIALEMETYNDIVVLDIKENMNEGKTHTFFRWANENATVPVYYKTPVTKKYGPLTPSSSVANNVETYNLAFKKADYVVKADDDAFLVLSELERHLRVAPRERAYWGYLIRNLFMGGECYALSADLVNYVATYPVLESYTTGAEDKGVARWMRMHPNASSISWITERCFVYDHPKASTTYSHGFLFPDEVERVRAEGRTGISSTERERRGGIISDAWSSVTRWKRPYSRPKSEMTMEEEVEALVEGGGRWSGIDGWTHKISSKDLVKWQNVVFEATDERIQGSSENKRRATQARSEYNARSETAFGRYNRMPNSLIRDPGDSDVRPQHAKRDNRLSDAGSSSESGADDELEASAAPSLSSFANITYSTSAEPASSASTSALGPGQREPDHPNQHPIGAPHYKQGYSLFPDADPNPSHFRQRAIPAPSLRFDAETMSVRERRFLGLPYGGTVVVHYLKRNEWFLETALALLGRERMWDTGIDSPAYPAFVPPIPASGGRAAAPIRHAAGPAQEGGVATKETVVKAVPTWDQKQKGASVELVSPVWGGARMYGSPLIKENGFVSLGRSVPWDALKQAETPKYGSIHGTPRQRYADLPNHSDVEDADHSSADPASDESSTPNNSEVASSSERLPSISPPASTSDERDQAKSSLPHLRMQSPAAGHLTFLDD